MLETLTSKKSSMNSSTETLILEEDNIAEEKGDPTNCNDDVAAVLPLEEYSNVSSEDDDIPLPPEMSNYLKTLADQTHRLEQELQDCDELLMYLPHQSSQSNDTHQAVVLYEDVKELEQLAGQQKMTVEIFKQKMLDELGQEQFTVEDVIREYQEFEQFRKELEEFRADILQNRSYDKDSPTLKQICASTEDSEKKEDITRDGSENVEGNLPLAICQSDHNDMEHNAAHNLSVARLSNMHDYILEQLSRIEEHHEIKLQNLVNTIQTYKHQDEQLSLVKEARRQQLHQEHQNQETIMKERLNERDKIMTEEQKLREVELATELSCLKTEINKLTEVISMEKGQYETARQEWTQKLQALRTEAAVQIQRVYRGFRTRKHNSTILLKMKERKALRKEEKYKIRVMQVEYEMKFREEQGKREQAEQDKKAAEEKLKKEEEERQKEIEKKRREEEAIILEKIRMEKERQKEKERLEDERRKHEDEELKVKEEKLKKEEDKKRKEEEKKRKKEEEERKKAETRRKKEEEKKRKETERRLKEEEKKRKLEEKRYMEEKLKEKEQSEEQKLQGEDSTEEKNEIKGVEKFMTDEFNVKVMGEKSDLLKISTPKADTKKADRTETKETTVKVIDGENIQGESIMEEANKTLVNQPLKSSEIEIKQQWDSSGETVKKSENLEDSSVKQSSLLEGTNKVLSTSSEQSSQSEIRNVPKLKAGQEKKQEECLLSTSTTENSLITSEISDFGNKVQSPSLSSSKPETSAQGHHSSLEETLAKSSPMQQKSPRFVPPVVDTKRLESSRADTLEQQRLQWMKSCLPWSRVSCEPWKLKPASLKSHKRPSLGKKLAPVPESLILESTQASSLKEVSSVKLLGLSECSLLTFGQCWSLRYLTVTKCGLVCLEGLEQCKQLLYINAEENNIEYLDLRELGKLQVARLAHNKLSSIQGLEGCINLRWLDLSHNRVARIAGLDSQKRLHTLDLSCNQLVSSEGLSAVVTLQSLNLSHNFLQHLVDAHKLCLLSELDLSSNTLLGVPELQNQVLLTRLSLQENSIKSLDELRTCWLPLLQTLDCSQNLLESISGVDNLISLKCLDVSMNQITDLENLVPVLAGIPQLESLQLAGNPLVEVHANEYRELIAKTVPGLTSLDHQPLAHPPHSPLTSPAQKEEVGVLADFLHACLSQTQRITDLRKEFESQMKVLLVNPHVTADTLCSTLFSYCDSSFKMASEFRSAHEYGDFGSRNVTRKDVLPQSLDTTMSHSAASITSGFENMLDQMSVARSFSNQVQSHEKVSELNHHSQISDHSKSPLSLLTNNENVNNSNDLIDQSLASGLVNNLAAKRNQPLKNFFDTNTRSNLNTNLLKETNRQNNDKYGSNPPLNSSASFKTSTLEESKDQTQESNIHCLNSVRDSSLDISSFQNERRINNSKTVNSAQFLKLDQNISTTGVSAEIIQSDASKFQSNLSQKEKFELALKAGNAASGSTGIEVIDSRTKVFHGDLRGNLNPSGIKANVVASYLGTLQPQESGDSKTLTSSLGDFSFDLESLDFDIDKCLDMEDMDELLETGWRPTDVPHLSQSLYPVLGSIPQPLKPETRRHQTGNQVSGVPHSPGPPGHAWLSSPVTSEQESSPSFPGQDSERSVPTSSPSSVASAAETLGGGSVRSKMDEISEEWGFKDAHTVKMMLARAKKMKYNSERKNKLNKLDPQERLMLLRKLEQKHRTVSVRPPSTRTLPRKEYFQAREEELNRQGFEHKSEDPVQVFRTYEWLHTQVGHFPGSDSQKYPGSDHGFSPAFATRQNILGDNLSGKSVSPSDPQASSRKVTQQLQRYSSEGSSDGQTPTLPPIPGGSFLPTSLKKERISFRDNPVMLSGGWGSGKKAAHKK